MPGAPPRPASRRGLFIVARYRALRHLAPLSGPLQLILRTPDWQAPGTERLVSAFAWVAGLAFILGALLALGRLEVAFLMSLVLLIGWIALSISWSSDAEQSVLEVQRAMIYLVGTLTVVLVLRSRSRISSPVC